MSTIQIHRHPISLMPDRARVILRPFIPGGASLLNAIIDRTLALTEDEVERELQAVRAEFSLRYIDFEAALRRHYEKVQPFILSRQPLSLSRQALLGARFTGEYSVEAAALFNPSMVPHPDQSGLPEGAVRFIMSLRATGEGHISSIEFRSGVITATGAIEMDPITSFVSEPAVLANPSYRKRIFTVKLQEMGFDNACADAVMSPLSDSFTRRDLAVSVARIQGETVPDPHPDQHSLDCIQWLADSNYELCFSPDLEICERNIFPVSKNESNGIEDARFVRFTEGDGTVTYYATYTAYNGYDILPQLIETEDFLHFRVRTMNGNAVKNKGMALFPRRINGHYMMLSRQDDENIFIMQSDNPHCWSDPQILLRPAEPWEAVKLGNCGSPIETDAGWLVITHGVGALRKYCLGAVLLDLDDPTRVIGRLREPLLAPAEHEREGYVPNVVYSCGSLLHNNQLILPYAVSDTATSIASVNVEQLLAAMTPANVAVTTTTG